MLLQKTFCIQFLLSSIALTSEFRNNLCGNWARKKKMKQANHFLISRVRCFLLRSYPYAKLHFSSVNTLRNSVCLRNILCQLQIGPIVYSFIGYHSFYPDTYFPLYLSLAQVYSGLKSLTWLQIFCLSRTCVDIRQSQGCYRKFKSLSKEASSY